MYITNAMKPPNLLFSESVRDVTQNQEKENGKICAVTVLLNCQEE
jgi:hypothetical protein